MGANVAGTYNRQKGLTVSFDQKQASLFEDRDGVHNPILCRGELSGCTLFKALPRTVIGLWVGIRRTRNI